ncbi:MAG: large repetitive protein, partial [Gaiellaceae bacterium]|nr:large repetitive protein [Gaiellaceae bacterium]
VLVVLAVQALALGLLATGALGTSKDGPQIATPQISAGANIAHDVSQPLADLPAPSTAAPPARLELERQTPAVVNTQIHDPAVQSAVGSSNVPATAGSFEGVQLTDLTSQYLPPDTVGDVGPTQYVQAVNGGFSVFSKTGDSLTGAIDDSSFWSGLSGCQVSSTRGLTDPTVNYDQFADRWVYAVLSFDVTSLSPTYAPSYMCVAVSSTGDATGTWNRYSFQAGNSPLGGVLPDYPKLGVWPDGYYLSFNDFDNAAPHPFVGAGAMVLDRAAMLNGASAQSVFLDLRGVSGLDGGMLPADADGAAAPPSGAPNYFVTPVDDPADVNDQLGVWAFHTDWNVPGNSTFTNPQALHVAAFDGQGHPVPQPGTAVALDGLADDRMMNRNQYRDFGGYQTLVTNLTVDNGTGGDAPRWFELRKVANSWGVNQQSTYLPTATDRWLGSAAMDGAGDIALGYSAGDAATPAGLRYTGRLASDPLNTMQAEATLMTGGGSQTSGGSRWGDYTQMTVDPTDDCTFWYTGEYYAVTAAADWHTRIGSFRFPGCVTSSGPTYTVVPTTSGTLREGQTLTTTAGTWTPAPTLTAYQWRRCDSNGVSCLDIPGATAPTYVLQAADAGYRLRSKVTVSASGGSSSSAVSAVTGTVRPLAPVNSILPSVSGTAQVAQTLTATTGTWSTYTGAPNTFTYQWQRCSTGCAAIPGAIGASYTLAGADAGATVQIAVTATTIGGQLSALSAATGPVALPPAPANVVAPSITGTARVNEILTAQIGTWTGVAPITYTYQWQTCDAAGVNCAAIGPQTGATYQVLASDTGNRLRVTVTANNSGGASSINTSVTAVVTPLPPANLAVPVLAGSPVVGSALTTSDGTWSGGPVTYTYQWQSCNPGCVDIAGATSNRYDVTSSTLGATLRAVVTATNTGGATAANTVTSAAVSAPASGGGGGGAGGGSGGGAGGGSGGGAGSGGGSGSGSSGGAGSPDLVVTGFSDKSAPLPGETVTFVLTVTDKNGVMAQPLFLDFALPAGLQYVSSTMDRGNGCVLVNASQLQCNLQFLSSTAPTAHVQLTTKVAAAGPQTLTATASADQGDLNPADNTLSLAVNASGSSSSGLPVGLNGDGTPTKKQDKKAPTSRALTSAGKRGRAVQLRFKVYDDNGVAKITTTVKRNTKVVGTASTGFGPVAYGSVYFLGWKVPAKAAKGSYSFCVVAVDRAGNKSAQTCAPLALK